MKKNIITSRFNETKLDNDSIKENFTLTERIKLKDKSELMIYQGKQVGYGILLKFDGKDLNGSCISHGSNIKECLDRYEVVNFITENNLEKPLQLRFDYLNIELNSMKQLYVNKMSFNYIEAIKDIYNEQKENNIGAFQSLEIPDIHGEFVSVDFLAPYVNDIVKEYNLNNQDYIPENLATEIANQIFNDIESETEYVEILSGLINENKSNQYLNKPLLNNIEKFNNEKIEFNKNFQDISESKISLTMFRFDKDLNENIEQNNKFKLLAQEVIKTHNLNEKTNLSLESSEGFWCEKGNSSKEQGFTIKGSNNDINSFLPVTIYMMSNLNRFGLNPEHQQSGIYVKQENKSFIYEFDGKTYNPSIELDNHLSFSNSKILTTLENSSVISNEGIGGTIKNGVISMALSDQQKDKVFEILQEIGLKDLQICTNEHIQVSLENQKIKQSYKEFDEIPF